jgi:hypothetical protein
MEGNLDVRFTELGARRIVELHQIFHVELTQFSNKEYATLAFLAGEYGPSILENLGTQSEGEAGSTK